MRGGDQAPTEAVVDAERALAIRAKVGGTEAEFAELKFLLAQALWTAKREPTRWPRLATEARDAYRAAGAAHTGALANVERWIVAPE